MNRGERGSVFVEALVSTAIVAAVTAAMLTTVSEAEARRHQIDARRTALMIARSELAAVGAAIPLSPGAVEGAEGDFIWRVEVEPGPVDAVSTSLAGPPWQVAVSVRGAGAAEDLVTLRTLRLASAP